MNFLLVLRLLARSLESLMPFLPPSDIYESTDDPEFLLLFLSDSVILGWGDGEPEKDGRGF